MRTRFLQNGKARIEIEMIEIEPIGECDEVDWECFTSGFEFDRVEEQVTISETALTVSPTTRRSHTTLLGIGLISFLGYPIAKMFGIFSKETPTPKNDPP